MGAGGEGSPWAPAAVGGTPRMENKDPPPPSELCFCFGFYTSPSPLYPPSPSVGSEAAPPARQALAWGWGASKFLGFVCGLWLWDGHGYHRAQICSEAEGGLSGE